MFYKDIRDLLGVEFISTYNDAVYARVTNVDFGNVEGFTMSLNHRALGPLNVSLDYTWQNAQADASDPHETFTRAENKEDPRPRLVPLNWDQRHTLNLSIAVQRQVGLQRRAHLPRRQRAAVHARDQTSGFGGSTETNSGRKPAALSNVDLRAEKFVRVRDGGAVAVRARLQPVRHALLQRLRLPFDRQPVLLATAWTTRTLADPTRYFAPRRIEVGITVDSSRR